MPGPLDGILAGANDAASAPGSDRGSQAVHIAQLVRTILSLSDDVAVTVQQLTCREPGCPPVETVIAVLAASPGTKQSPGRQDPPVLEDGHR